VELIEKSQMNAHLALRVMIFFKKYRQLLIVGFAGFLFFLIVIFSGRQANLPVTKQISQSPIDNEFVEAIRNSVFPEQMVYGLPLRLKIPKINVDAAVVYVGLTSQGAMDIPEGPADVAWFNLGPRPGEVGSAVISCHYGWKNSIPAVFDNLHKLRKGDKLYIEDDKGATITFVVRESRVYDSEEDAPNVFISTDGSHLNLVTCSGAWNKDKKNYAQRLVVFTDAVK
jgi:LPXTG-site transpeptidase (sortase) family protein